MNTNEIRCVLSRALMRHGSPTPLLRFRGVYAADEVPIDNSNTNAVDDASVPWCCVANTDPHDKPGEHWVAFVFDVRNNCYEYFDPYGMPLATYPALHARIHAITASMRQCHDPVATHIQPPLSTTCGHFCIYFLCQRSVSSYPQIIKHLLSVPMRHRDTYVYDCMRALTSTLSIRRPCRDACTGSQCCRPSSATR